MRYKNRVHRSFSSATSTTSARWLWRQDSRDGWGRDRMQVSSKRQREAGIARATALALILVLLSLSFASLIWIANGELGQVHSAGGGELVFIGDEVHAAEPAPATAAVTLTAYHGSLHNHTGYSDGVLDPHAAFTAGRQRGLDFMAVTDHSEQIDDGEWEDTLDQAISHTVAGKFVALAGCEYTNSAEGHTNVFNTITRPAYVDQGYGYAEWVPTLADFYAWMAQHPEAVGQFNHPTWYGKNFNNWAYDGAGETGMQMVEVGSGPSGVWSEEEYRQALDHGWRIGPTNNGDTHTDQWGIDNLGRSGIWAADLTPAGVLEAMRSMRLFATEDGNAEIYLRGDGAWMGRTIPNDGAVDFEIYAYDPDGESLASLNLYTYGGQIVTSTVPGTNPFLWSFQLELDASMGYYFARAEQTDGDRLVTAPLWTWGVHVVVNEFSTRGVEWVELYNATPLTVDMGGWLLTSEYGGLSHTFPAGHSLAPGSTHLVLTGGNFLVDDGDVLHLYTAALEEQDRVGFGRRGGAPSPRVYESSARTPNGYDHDKDAWDWNLDSMPSPDAGNDAALVALGSSILINEINTTAPPAGEALEFYNPSGTGVSIDGWTIGDGDTRGFIPSGFVPPEGWLVINPKAYGVDFGEDDVAYLFMPDGKRVDQIGWAGTVESGTFQRICDGEGPNNGYDWNSSGGGTTWYDLPDSLGASNCAPLIGLVAANDSPTALGGLTTLTATVSGGNPLNYLWDLGDGATADSPVVSHTYPAPGVYTAIVTASNPVSQVTATTTVVVRGYATYLPLIWKAGR